MFARTVRPVLRSLLVRSEKSSARVRSYHEPSHLKQTTIDDLPTPQGAWKTNYNSNQSGYNIHLVLGVLMLAGSLVVAQASGCFVLNMSPPSLKKEEE